MGNYVENLVNTRIDEIKKKENIYMMGRVSKINDYILEVRGLENAAFFEEVIIGEAEVRQLFHFSKVGNIAGSHVTSGVVKVNTPCRVIRDGIVVTTSKIASLQREKDQAHEVKSGFDCGMTIESFPDIKEGDRIEAFEIKEVKK